MPQDRTFHHDLVSVITVTRNAASNLEKTLKSVEAQQYEAIEQVVVDGLSTDDTVDIIHKHEKTIARWVSEPDRGIYDAMNKGVSMARGEWVLFMNAGDTFASDDVLQRIFSHRWNAEGVLYGDVVKDGYIKKAPGEYHLYHRMLFCHQSSLTRRSLLIASPFDISHRLSADFKFFMEQYQRGVKFAYVGMPVANFDTTGVSNTRRSLGLRDNMRVVRELVPFPLRLKFTLRLMVPYIMCKIRGK
jgi:putative colanic acid biosynthesis glycosyltransferase